MGLLLTQFLGAVNDNMFRWLVVPIGKEIVADLYGSDHMSVVLSGRPGLLRAALHPAGRPGRVAESCFRQR